MKRIMILGASILQLPAILKAKEMGFKVIAVDKDKNAVGFKYADVCLEISTIDTPAIIKAAKENNIDGIMTLASDLPMLTVATVSQALGLKSISVETAHRATNKAKMRVALKDCNIPIPRFYIVKTYEEYLKAVEYFDGKYIVKPTDNSGSRGIYLVKDEREILTAYHHSKENSRCGDILVEEYMEGKEVSVETFTINGETTVLAITDKLTTGAPYFVEMGHSQPTQHTKVVAEEIKNVAIKAVAALGINTGPSHVEIKVTPEGAKIVELGARMGGDYITTHLVPLSTGIDMVKHCIDLAIGEKVDIKPLHRKGAAIRYFNSKKGLLSKISNIEIANKFSGIININITKKVGDYVGEIISSSDRFGYVISQANTATEAIEICNKVLKTVSVEVV